MVAVPSGAGARAVAGAIYHLVQGLQTVQPTHYLKYIDLLYFFIWLQRVSYRWHAGSLVEPCELLVATCEI